MVRALIVSFALPLLFIAACDSDSGASISLGSGTDPNAPDPNTPDETAVVSDDSSAIAGIWNSANPEFPLDPDFIAISDDGFYTSYKYHNNTEGFGTDCWVVEPQLIGKIGNQQYIVYRSFAPFGPFIANVSGDNLMVSFSGNTSNFTFPTAPDFDSNVVECDGTEAPNYAAAETLPPHGARDVSPLAGLWDTSTTVNGTQRTSYLNIEPYGVITVIALNEGLNCYKNTSGQLASIGGNQYRFAEENGATFNAKHGQNTCILP